MTINSPWFFALLSFFAYSFWGLFNGLLANKVEPFSGLFFSSVGYFLAGLLCLSLIQFKPQFTVAGVGAGLSLGLMTGFGGLFLLMAIQKLSTSSLLIVLTSLYPLGTIVLSWLLLRDSLTPREIFGALLALAGVIIMIKK